MGARASLQNKRQRNFFQICSQCKNNCCQNAKPPITDERKRIIETYLREQKIPNENLFAEAEYTYPMEDAEGYCIFYDKKSRKCKIHPVKPETCVAGPVTFDINRKTQKIEWYLKTEKICPLAGKIYKNKQLLNGHLQSAKKEILRLINELNPKALQAILKIEEPETFKIDEENVGKEILNKLE
jgi:Fe-S-cluster containining protein